MPVADRDAESRKKRSALSCAECRRLKLKCDRNFPCSSCKKRGCAAICPDGVLTTGKLGGRFILANTEELHEKISVLQERIAGLEDALALAHASSSKDANTHPLLRPDLLAIKTPLGAEMVQRGAQGEGKQQGEGPTVGEEEEAFESFGTLKLGEGGVSTYYGTTVGSEFLFEEKSSDEDPDPIEPEVQGNPSQPAEWASQNISQLAHAIPLATLTTDVETVKLELRGHLPPYEAAYHLARCYFNDAAWMYNPLDRDTFDKDIFTPLYDASQQSKYVSFHALSVAFIVFALGALVDLDREPYDPEADRFYLLSRAALSVESCLENTTIASIQALLLMAYYNQMTDNKAGPALTWTFNGLAMKLAQSVGLHRDWEKWGLPSEEVAVRRTVMWECIVFDSWSAFGFGRPPSLAMHFVDCKQTPDPQNPNDPCASFVTPKYAFTELLLDVVNVSFSASPPTYEEILKLDRRLRDYYIPPLFQVAGINEDGNPRPRLPPDPPLALALQSHALTTLREIALLYMHRSFFAKALNEHPDNPFSDRYAASVLACHRSACQIIVIVQKLHNVAPRLVLRFWYFWVHSFTAAVVLAAIVTKSPSSNLAQSSLMHVDLACQLFQELAAGSRPAGSLPILLKIRQKAVEAFQSYTSGAPSPPDHSQAGSDSSGTGAALDPMLGGKTRVSKPKKKTKPEASSPESKPPLDYYVSNLDIARLENAHPSLVDHLRTVSATQAPGSYPSLQWASDVRATAEPSATPLSSSGYLVPDPRAAENLPAATRWRGDYIHNPTVNVYGHVAQSTQQPVGYDMSAQYGQSFLDPPSQHGDFPMDEYGKPAEEASRQAVQYQQRAQQVSYGQYQPPAVPAPEQGAYHDTRPQASNPYSLGPYDAYAMGSSSSWQPSHERAAPGPLGYSEAAEAGGLLHSGDVGAEDQNWNRLLSGVDFPTSGAPSQP